MYRESFVYLLWWTEKLPKSEDPYSYFYLQLNGNVNIWFKNDIFCFNCEEVITIESSFSL